MRRTAASFATRHPMNAVRLTGRGAGMVAGGGTAVAAGLLTQSVVVMAAGVFVLTLVVLATGWALLRRRGAVITRTHPALTARYGEPLTATADLTIARPDQGPAMVSGLVPGWAASQEVDPGAESVVRLDRHHIVLQRSFATAGRGVYPWPGMRVEYPDPLGIARGITAAPAGGTTIIFPRLEPLGGGSPPHTSGTIEGPERLLASAFLSGHAGNPVPRSYQPGDDLRRMHWPATARSGEPMVRDEDEEPERRAVVAVDCVSESYRTQEGFERAITAAGSIAGWLLDRDWSISLRTLTGTCLTAQDWQRGQRGQIAVLSALAALEPEVGATAAAVLGAVPTDAVYAIAGGSTPLGASPLPMRTLMLSTESHSEHPAMLIWDGSTPLGSVLRAPELRRAGQA